MAENAELLDVLYAAGDALSVLLLLIGASVLIEAVLEAGTHRARYRAPARQPGAAGALPRARASHN